MAEQLPYKFRRSSSIVISLLSALLLLGIIEGVFKINVNTNIWDTGITVGLIMGVLQLFLLYLIVKHRVP